MNAVLKWCRQTDQKLFLHLCLQHVKKNIRDEFAKGDSVTGHPRSRNAELLPVILEFVQFFATLPSDLQFHTFWSSILTRMASGEAAADFNEPVTAAYLREHILKRQRYAGLRQQVFLGVSRRLFCPCSPFVAMQCQGHSGKPVGLAVWAQ